MIIYPLPPEELDDKTLDEQIEAIAQTLCNVHYRIKNGAEATIKYKGRCDRIPLELISFDEFSEWASECLANYLKLVEMGLACCEEYRLRFSEPLLNIYGEEGKVKEHKLQYVIEWARENVPELPVRIDSKYNIDDSCIDLDSRIDKEITTPFPLVMPEEYKVYFVSENGSKGAPFIIESYRNYYRAKLYKKKQCKNHEPEYEFTNGECPECLTKSGIIEIEPKWTRREKPNWLEAK
jgi:hypothetical protein